MNMQKLLMLTKVIGKMKDEFGKGYMTEFIALSLKVYAFEESRLDNSLIEHKEAKGTKKNVTKKESLLCYVQTVSIRK